MKNYYFFYQDTIVSVQKDTLDVNAIEATQDSSEILKTENDSISSQTIQTQPSIVKKPVQKVTSIETQNTQIVQTKPSDKPEIIEGKKIVNTQPKNFLKIIEKDNSIIKPENVFVEQQPKLKNSYYSDLGKGQPLQTNDWLLPVFFICLAIMIWVRKLYDRQISLLFSSVNNYQMSMKLFNDPSSRFKQLSYILNFNAALTVGLFLFQLLNFYNLRIFDGNQLINFLFIVAFLLLLYIIQFISYSVLGNILKGQKEYYEFLHHTYTLIKVLGIIIIPVTVINAYAAKIIIPFFLYIGLLISIFFYFKRIQRGVLILMQKQFLKFHQILYFCILEILPLMVLSKFVNSLIERSF